MTCNDSAMASVTSGGMTSASLTWEKLSPAEFQQLQDFAACKRSFLHEKLEFKSFMNLFTELFPHFQKQNDIVFLYTI